jgi:hypothetical protein
MKEIILPGTGKAAREFVLEVAAEINRLVGLGATAISAAVAAAKKATLPSGVTSRSAYITAAIVAAMDEHCRYCVRHGLTGKLEPRTFKRYFPTMEFHPMSPEAAITDFERYVKFVTGYRVVKSMNRSLANALLASPDLKDNLYHLTRIFEFPIPVMNKDGKGFTPLDEGFNLKSAATRNSAYYCGPSIDRYVSLSQAKDIIEKVFKEFCFDSTHKQSKVHAIARLLTPYCQGLMGFQARSPLWIFQANRSRAGKDYCAAIAPLVFMGSAPEDAPLDQDDSENKRRITASIIAGHRFMHFANCRINLDQCPSLESAVTAKVWVDRVIGSSENIKMANEIIFSLSFNGSFTLSPDMGNRCRRIKLFLHPDVNPSKRLFADLHEWLTSENGRRDVIAALHALVENWIKIPPSKRPSPIFTSFPEWGEVVGGIMLAAGYDSPCDDDPEDKKSVVREWEEEIHDLTNTIGKKDSTTYFEPKDVMDKFVKTDPKFKNVMDRYDDENAYCRVLGRKLRQYAGKELGGGLKIDLDNGDLSRPKYRFHPAPLPPPPPPAPASGTPATPGKPPKPGKPPNPAVNLDPFSV